MTILKIFIVIFLSQNGFLLFPAARLLPNGFDELDVNAIVAGSFPILHLEGCVL